MTKAGFDFLWLLRKSFLKFLVGGSIIVFIMSYIVTSPLFFSPKYQSEAIINVPLTLVTQQHAQQGIGFGGNVEIDWHIQVLMSTRMLDSLASRFGYFSTAEISPGDINRVQIHNQLLGKISIEKNRYGSVSVKVSHEQPQKAADMANAIVELGDIIREDILYDNRRASYHFARDLYLQKKEELENTGIDEDVTKQRQITGNIFSEDTEPVRRVLFEAELWQLSQLKTDYEMIRKSIDSPIPSTYIISEAMIAQKPVWPPRLLIAAGAVILFIIGMIFYESVKRDAFTSEKTS